MSENTRKQIYDMTGGKCFYCGCVLDFDRFHLDHFNAKAYGGKAKGNLVPSCPDCNIYKGTDTVEGFRRKINRCLHDTIRGRMLRKYYGIEEREIKFYYEVVKDGAIQNNINEFLDGRKDC